MTGCDAYPAPVPYEKSLQAQHDTGPGKDICWFEWTAKDTGSRHGQPPTHHTTAHSAFTRSYMCQVNSKPYARLAKPQQHGNNCDYEGIPTHSALFFVELDREWVLQFFFARPQKYTSYGGLSRVPLHFFSFSFGPINRRRRAAIEAQSRRCRRQHALSSSFTWQDTYPHVFCVLPLLSITCRERAPRWIATPLATSRNSTTRSRTR